MIKFVYCKHINTKKVQVCNNFCFYYNIIYLMLTLFINIKVTNPNRIELVKLFSMNENLFL